MNKLNIQVKTKSTNQVAVLSASSEMSRPGRVDITWHGVFASGPGCGPNLETLSQSLSFPWKPNMEGSATQHNSMGWDTCLGGAASNWRGRSLGSEDVSYKQKCCFF